nr:HNH endonuclease [Bradyrhizobium sp.]
MRCIFCSKERPPSLEHVVPLAIGGSLTTDRVCEPCNSELGSRVDLALTDYLPIRVRRGELGLAGNSRKPPGRFELLTGDVELVGEAGGRLRVTYDEATNKLDLHRLYQATDAITPDGQKIRQIVVDARDKEKVTVIINRERKRHGMPPLSDEELAIEVSKLSVNTLVNPTVRMNICVSYAYLRHAMFKIAYELAFLWLGESYLDDPLAAALRTAICKPEVGSLDSFHGFVGPAADCEAFSPFWKPHQSHHLAYSQEKAGNVVIAVRIFDLYAAVVLVSTDAARYFDGSNAHPTELRFVAMDAVSGNKMETTFAEEVHRIVTTWQATRTFPSPVPDLL